MSKYAEKEVIDLTSCKPLVPLCRLLLASTGGAEASFSSSRSSDLLTSG